MRTFVRYDLTKSDLIKSNVTMHMKTRLLIACLALLLMGCVRTSSPRLVVLHTNDTHSQVEPISHGAKNGNKAGYARRYALIDSVRSAENSPILLVDAGDFSQGTPYYNFYHGRIEVEAMNRMSLTMVWTPLQRSCVQLNLLWCVVTMTCLLPPCSPL